MGLMDKLKAWSNGNDQDDEYTEGDDYEYDRDGGDDPYYDGAPQQDNRQNNQQQTYQQPRQSSAQNSGAGMSLNSSALEMKLVKPERYDSNTAQKIADHLLNKRTVVLNLESTNKESARRLIDFLSGVAYSIDGNITRVSTNTVVIVPNNVDVSGEQLQDQMKKENNNLDDII